MTTRHTLQESKLRSEVTDLKHQLEDMTRQAEGNKEHDAALDDLLKQKQELIQERDNQAGLATGRNLNKASDQVQNENAMQGLKDMLKSTCLCPVFGKLPNCLHV